MDLREFHTDHDRQISDTQAALGRLVSSIGSVNDFRELDTAPNGLPRYGADVDFDVLVGRIWPARRDGWHYDVCRGGVLAAYPDAEVEVGAATRNGGAVLMVVVTIVIGRTVYVLSAATVVGATTPLFIAARGE